MGQEHWVQIWAGRTCLAVVLTLVWLGFYFANIRFLPVAAGFAILSVVCYTWTRREIPAPRVAQARPSQS